MKILQLTNKPPWPPRDGGAIAMLNMTTGFYGSGNQVTVLAMNTRKHHVRPEDLPGEIRKTADFRLVEVSAAIHPLKALINLLFSTKPYTAVRFISEPFRIALKDLLQSSDFDLIQLEGTYLCPYIPLIRQHTSAPVALRAHNIESEIWERSAAAASGWKKLYFSNLSSRIRRFEQKWLNQYDFLIPITERDGDHFRAKGNRKPVMIVPGGIDFSGLEEPSEGEGNSLFHIGSLDWMPNQEGLIWFVERCWERIHMKHPHLTFRVAGRNAPGWLVERLNLPGILYCGEVEDAQTFMRSNGIMVVPLFSGSGMRIKIIEAMALGKAIVTTPTGAEGVEVTDRENIMLAGDADSFILKTEELLRDDDLSHKIGMKAREFARKNYDHLSLAQKLTDFYLQNNVK